ncbi:MAG: hypothetical protein HYR55_07225 [Acidobacteria bacterium]|nr:hypothetical protein [Acidobacteriota bacterium]MBI3658268.1 hypothetical protein [Acidobacteriota bacterium]
MNNDWTVRCDNRYFQILKNNVGLPRPGDPLTVSQWLDGSIHLLYKGRPLKYKELPERPRQCRGAAENAPVEAEKEIYSRTGSSLAPMHGEQRANRA